MKRLACGLLTLAIGITGGVHAGSDEDLVVMVEARFGESGNKERGAGIVIEESAERTVIVTALHVVEIAEGEKASDITVEFSSLRGQVFKATTNGFYADPSIDLAVIFVDRPLGSIAPKVIDESNRNSISPSPPTGLAGASVKIIGAMRSGRWSTGTQHDRIVSGSNRSIQVSSSAAGAGASGCAVFDTLGRLLGMGTQVDSATGYLEAVPIAAITRKMKSWKLASGLTVAEAGTTSAEISGRFSKELQITSTYIPAPPDQLGFSTTFRLAAKITPLLQSLSPTRIEISYSRWYPEVVTTAVLLPPDFSVEHSASPRKENAQVWVVIADGRRLGPYPLSLDFETDPIAAVRRTEPRVGIAAVNGTLKIIQNNLAIEKANDEAAAKLERERAEAHRAVIVRDATPTAEDFAEVRATFHDWDESCRRKPDSPWECEYPLFITNTRLRALRSVQLGATQNSLKVELPVDDVEEFRPAFARAAAKLLDDHPEMTQMYMRVHSKEGDVLGPKVICRVSLRKNTNRASCNNW